MVFRVKVDKPRGRQLGRPNSPFLEFETLGCPPAEQREPGGQSLTERLAKPYVDRVKYPSLSANDRFEDSMRELIAGELRVLEANNLNTRETGANADGARLPADSATS